MTNWLENFLEIYENSTDNTDSMQKLSGVSVLSVQQGNYLEKKYALSTNELKQFAGEDWEEISQDSEKLEAFADAHSLSRYSLEIAFRKI